MEPVELKIITRNETKKGLEEIVRDTGKVGQTVEQVTERTERGGEAGGGGHQVIGKTTG